MKTLLNNVDSALYILLTLTMMYLLTKLITTASVNTGYSKKIRRTMFIIFSGILIYCMVIGPTGFLSEYSLPPRFLIFLILPGFTIIVISVRKLKLAGVIDTLQPQTLILYQSFRILIESIFVVSVSRGHLHKEVSIEGYNIDLIYATLSLGIYFLYTKKIIADTFVFLWNIVGLLVIAWIIFIFTTTIYFPHMWGSNTSLAPYQVGLFPYILVPMFLMPSAVFVHILSLIRLRSKPVIIKPLLQNGQQ